jgi:hypothetical protein
MNIAVNRGREGAHRAMAGLLHVPSRSTRWLQSPWVFRKGQRTARAARLHLLIRGRPLYSAPPRGDEMPESAGGETCMARGSLLSGYRRSAVTGRRAGFG